MVLRKKQEQISFLHVYHHTCMVFATWMAVRYVAGKNPFFFPCSVVLIIEIFVS